MACLSGGLTLGCAGRNSNWQDGYPNAPARTIIAEPGGYEDVYIADQQYQEQVVEGRQVVGYDTLSDGTRVEVVQYVHTYEDPIDTYPRVYWGNSWYYNVNGDFVYWSPAYGGWVYYWGPPVALVSCWNAYYPWAPYYWGVGFYGAGWYWGGVGHYGYHAYGVPVVNPYHHHHTLWADTSPDGPSSGHPGGPTNDPSPGGPADRPARRDQPDRAPVAERNKPPVGATPPSADPAQRGVPPSRADAGDRIAGEPAKRDSGASRTPTRDGGVPTRDGVGPTRADGDRVAGAAPERKPTRTVPVRSYTNGTGQRVTTIDPQSGRAAAARNPSPAPLRQSRSLGTVQQGPARDPFAASRSTQPRWDQPAAAPSRSMSWSSSSSGRNAAAPSRSSSPSSSGPSRASAPSHSGPSRSFSSSHSSSPSRSMSPPSRSSSGGGRSFSSPSHSGGGRSYSSPSRSSSGGGGRSFSGSSGGGGGRSSGATRSSGGGGGGGRSSGASRR